MIAVTKLIAHKKPDQANFSNVFEKTAVTKFAVMKFA